MTRTLNQPDPQSVMSPPMVLQNVIFPEQGICTELDLFVHLEGIAAYSQTGPHICLGEGARARFDTYFNLFSVGKWHAAAPLATLSLCIDAAGQFELRVYHAIPERSWELLCSEVFDLPDRTEISVALDHHARGGAGGVIFFEVHALRATVVHAARFATRDAPARDPQLAICITTFRREAAIAEIARRLDRFIEDAGLAGRVGGFVVDNGGSADIGNLRHIRQVANRNLGGAGGFARGMAEAASHGYSHCLFMDDDAAAPTESIRRALAFLAHAADDRTAIAGAMISTSHRWAMWEAGARFFEGCQPLQGGRDLRQREEVLALEFDTGGTRDPQFYGGFWFFAFPLAHARAHPFPFFVRGDDVSFSLMNDFRPVTLNGVVAFQEDFTEKESVLTHYLDLRSHLVHHLVAQRMRLGRWRGLRLPLRFLARSLSRFHYETAEAEILAWRDVLRGPQVFADNPDLTERRGKIAALTQHERWQAAMPDRAGEKSYLRPPPGWLLRWTLNGHLLPLASVWGRHAKLPASRRADLAAVRGAHTITCRRAADGLEYRVTRSDRRFLHLLAAGFSCSLRQLLTYRDLCRDYEAAYPSLTSAGYWTEVFAAQKNCASAQRSEDVGQIEYDDDRDRNADQPGENTFHGKAPEKLRLAVNAPVAPRVPRPAQAAR